MIRVSIIVAIGLWCATSHADNADLTSNEQTHTQAVAAQSEVDHDQVMTRTQSLANYMGYTDKDAAFGQPRDFRTTELNQVNEIDDGTPPDSNNQ